MSCTNPQAPLPPLTIDRGASKAFLFTVRDAAKNPLDITGAKVWFNAKNRIEDANAIITKKNVTAGGVDNQILINAVQTGATKGQLQVFIDPADSALLDPAASYWCDLWIQLVGGPPIKRYRLMLRGLVVDPSVTTDFN